MENGRIPVAKMAKKSSRMAPEQIIRTLEGHKGELRGFGVKKIGLFGSFLSGTPRKDSDVDFLVEFGEPTFDNYMDLKFLLEALFGRKADVVSMDCLKPALRHIRKEALYAKGL
jgi:predicted nucleotidyltransferase